MAKKHRHSKRWIKLIANPESGEGQDSTARLQQVVGLLQAEGFKVGVALANPKEKAEKIARRAVKKGYRRVAVMGGDGTIEAAARALVGTKTRLGILPGGTENNLVKSLGIPEDMAQAVRLLKAGKTTKIDAGQITNPEGKRMYFFELAAVGLVAELFPDAKRIPQGQLEKIGAVIGELARFQMPRISLKLDKTSRLVMETLMVTVMNAPSFGQAFLVSPEASMDDGYLNVNIYPNLSKAQVASFFAQVHNGGKSDDRRILRYRAKKLTIKAEPPQEAMADGIMLGKGTVKIKVKKHALRVIAREAAGKGPEAEKKK